MVENPGGKPRLRIELGISRAPRVLVRRSSSLAELAALAGTTARVAIVSNDNNLMYIILK